MEKDFDLLDFPSTFDCYHLDDANHEKGISHEYFERWLK